MGGQALTRRVTRCVAVGLLAAASSCSLLPGELNLFPLYRHRLDADGTVLEMDVLWPIVHFERTEDGTDFRIRPLYRRVSSATATEHQFLWPLGRIRADKTETHARLLPLWSYSSRINEQGKRDVDWNAALLLWGGWSGGGGGDSEANAEAAESYFAFLPFYADIPQFLFYDRFQTHLFPLHVHLERGSKHSEIVLWPLIGWGGDGDQVSWSRFLPFYGRSVDESRYQRHSVLWPFVHWGIENIDTGDPLHRFFLFPLFGRQISEKVDAWTFLWPFFQKMSIRDRMLKLDVLWPFFRYQHKYGASGHLRQWWFWPLVSHTTADRQRSWVFLWPLIWLRRYDDPDGVQTQQWVLPIFWHTHRDRRDGTEDDFLKVWPLFHRTRSHDGTSDWSVGSPWPWRQGNAYGVEEAYGWLWTLAAGKSSPGDESMHAGGHLFTTRKRHGRRQTSVPFLFNYESDEQGATLRLLQILPIPFGGGKRDR